MGRPRKNSRQSQNSVVESNITTLETEDTSKVSITEEDKTVRFVSGTQKQYNNKARKNTSSKSQVTEVVTNIVEEQPKRYIMGKMVSTNKPRKTHIVKRGESIQSIAGLYSVPVMKLIKLNGTTEVSVGQTIYID